MRGSGTRSRCISTRKRRRTPCSEDLAASGWQTSAILMRLAVEAYANKSAAMASNGMEEVKWLKPVYAGETLTGRATVLSRRVSAKRPEMGILKRMMFELFNDSGRAQGRDHRRAVHAGAQSMIGLYLEEIEHWTRASSWAATTSPARQSSISRSSMIRSRSISTRRPRGTGPFGVLSASGWHTAAAWMKRYVATNQEAEARMLREGREPAPLGPSPGFTNLRWLKPVTPGDTIRYRGTVTGKRELHSRPAVGPGVFDERGLQPGRHAGVLLRRQGADAEAAAGVS